MITFALCQVLDMPGPQRARSLVVSDLRWETKGSRFAFDCKLCAEVSALQ